jgi:hypothetical protein
MSNKSAVLLVGLGLAATAAGAWVVRMRSNQTDAIEADTVPAPRADTPLAPEWTGDDEDALAGGLAAAADDEPVNVR